MGLKPHEIFRRLGDDEVANLVAAACEQEAAMPEQIAAMAMKLWAMKLSKFLGLDDAARETYVRRTLRDRRSAELPLLVLTAALTKLVPKMLERFLTELEIPHEGTQIQQEGALSDPGPEKLGKAVKAVGKTFPARWVALYLHAFAAQPDVRWASLDALLGSDTSLALEDKGPKG